MKKLLSLSAALVGVGLSLSVQAAPIVQIGGTPIAGQGQTSSIAGVTVIDFNSPFTLPAGITCTGCSGALFTGTTGSVSAAPPGDASQYLSLRPGTSPVTIALSSPANYIGFFAASLDTFNTITFNGAITTTYTGAQLAAIAGVPPNGDQTEGFYFNVQEQGNDFTSVTLASSRPAFELDNFAIGRAQLVVPEPGSLALFGLAALGLGAIRRRK